MAFGIVSVVGGQDACTLRMAHIARPSTSMLSVRAAKGRAAGAAAGRAAKLPEATSKFKLLAVIVPPFALDAGDRDIQVGARGFWTT